MRPPELNDAQWQAVGCQAGRLLIVAGPGTGKTHTLTHRIARFLPKLGAGQKVLAITFTHKAGQEMRERLEHLYASSQQQLTVATFHSLSLSLLREYFSRFFPSGFTVPDVKQIGSFAKELWPQLKARQRKDQLERISVWKARDFDQPAFAQLLEYNAGLREKGWLDFDDLLLETVTQLRDDPDVRQTLQHQYPFVFVDEYQDINAVQHQLLKLLVGESGMLTVIGDPHQAIYGFRGCDVEYFRSFAQDFSGAVTLSLSENYRSSQHLVAVSSQIMRARNCVEVPQVTARIYKEGRLVVHQAATDKAEAEYVVHQIEKMVGGTSMFSRDSGRTESQDQASRGFAEIAVLFRLKSQQALLEEAFDRSGIPYRITQEREYEDSQAEMTSAFKHSAGSDKVSLMTLHASKGLEFGVVFIVGCEEGLLPLDLEGMTCDREEERRLFYVGVTRAKEQLFLVHAGRRRIFGQSVQFSPSELLSDIAEDLKEYDRLSVEKKRLPDPQLKLWR